MKRNFSRIVDEYFSLYKGNLSLNLAKNLYKWQRLKRALEFSIQCLLIVAILFSGFTFGKGFIKLNHASGGENSFGKRPPFVYDVIYDSLEEMWLDTEWDFKYFDFKFKEEELSITSFQTTYYKKSNEIHSIKANYLIEGKKISAVHFSVSSIKLNGTSPMSYYDEIILYNELILYKIHDNDQISNVKYYFYENGLSYALICSLNIFSLDISDQEILDIVLGDKLDETAPPIPDTGEEEPFPGDDEPFPGDDIELP